MFEVLQLLLLFLFLFYLFFSFLQWNTLCLHVYLFSYDLSRVSIDLMRIGLRSVYFPYELFSSSVSYLFFFLVSSIFLSSFPLNARICCGVKRIGHLLLFSLCTHCRQLLSSLLASSSSSFSILSFEFSRQWNYSYLMNHILVFIYRSK